MPITMPMLDGLLILFTLIVVRVQADHGPYFRSAEYDEGKFGEWPTETYRSSAIVGPRLNYLQYSDECKDGLYTLMAPRGGKVVNPGPMILDQDGHLVWTKHYGPTYNLNVYPYKGQDYLTFWVGTDGVGGHGEGAYYMLDASYREVYKIHAANHLPGDLHEFHITKDNTALITIYDMVPANLTSVDGLEEGWIWDGTFQELDIETGKALFQWRASDHFNFTDMYRTPEGTGDSTRYPWDFFHINSVDKDTHGNYLISSRYANTLAYINGRTGAIIWHLGGKNNDFHDLSNGTATSFSWQHHARFHSNSTITLFDNASRGPGAPELPSRGLHLHLNQDKMTAQVLHEYHHPDTISSQSQGSMQLLPDKKVLLGYGHIPTWTEYAHNGTLLCHTHFGLPTGNIMSYRVLKAPWIGRPITAPDLSVYHYTAAVSWNGATEVVTWSVERASSPTPKSYVFLTAVPKSGFETVIPIPPDAEPGFLRVVGLNATGHVLGSTKLVRWDPDSEEPVVGRHDEVVEGGASSVRELLFFIGGVGGALGIAFAGWVLYRRYGSLLSAEDREREGWQPLDRFNGDEDLSDGEMMDGEGQEYDEWKGRVSNSLYRDEDEGLP
ncbi:ASST-domain-containing protein [Aspergillus coremiiformis]|uniref:ASST-domain-containing protein n=1 Tax=Aspergillus coremiiformis TaxID=138285 RepID=A0A5N6YTM1_9EURO|nr:ASST-domain-containing protein [Aspergillus coremiiformis]